MPIPTEITLKSADTPAAERFNYTGMHRYLLTLPAHGPGATFTGREIVTRALDALREAGWHHHFDIYAYCFLPDRLLLIIRGREETSRMKEFLREFRASSEAALAPLLGHVLWSKKYLERVLRKTELTSEAAMGIFREPVKLGLAPSPKEYPHQGSFVRDTRTLFGPVEKPSRPDQGGMRPGGYRAGAPGKSGGRPGGYRAGAPGKSGGRPGGHRTGPPGKRGGPYRKGSPKGKARH